MSSITLDTLVDAPTLATHLNDPRWVIIDCRYTLDDPNKGYDGFVINHIPNASYAHLDDDLSGSVTPSSGRHPLPAPDDLARKLGKWGIDNHTQVIAYDNSGGGVAARLWWLLRWLGHSAVAVLDGGYAAWQQAGYPISPQIPLITTKRFKPHANHDLWLSTASLIKAMEKEGRMLVDARTEKRFTGEEEPLDKIAGHIPGAINLPYLGNLDGEGKFIGAHELRQRFLEKMGSLTADKLVHMCGSGVTACHNILAMEIAALPGSKIYPGSWSEWITDSSRPVATGN